MTRGSFQGENLKGEISPSRIKLLDTNSVMEGYGFLPSVLAKSNIRCRGFACAWKAFLGKYFKTNKIHARYLLPM